MNVLFELGRKHKSVKCYKKFVSSWGFCETIYPKYFEHRRSSIKTLLELGVHSGGSLRMWEEYFPNAEIYGIDISDSNVHFADDSRIHFRLGDQADEALLERVSDEVGQWDIVIDDASHIAKDQIISFETLWPRVSAGGVYCIEDIGVRQQASLPCVTYFQDLINKKFVYGRSPSTTISCITFCYQMIIIERTL